MTILLCSSILQTSAECLLCAGDCFLCALESESLSRSVMSDFVARGLQPARLLCPWDSPSKDAGVGSHSLLEDLPDSETEPTSLMSLALAGGFFTTVPPGKPCYSTPRKLMHYTLTFIY